MVVCGAPLLRPLVDGGGEIRVVAPVSHIGVLAAAA